MSISDIYRQVATSGVSPTTSTPSPKNSPEMRGVKADEFQKLLTHEQSKVNLSQHAETRIKSRAIPWDAAIEKRISSGIDQAQAKGSRETLILADDLAVIANVKSRTVITAMDKDQMKEKIFTNIDSAVLV